MAADFPKVCSCLLHSNGKLVDIKGKVQEVAKKDTCDPCMFVTVSGCRLYFGSLVGDP